MKINALKFLRKLILKGNNIYCPCCVKQFSTFLPYGNPVRFNVKCPDCYSLERHRLLWLFLFDSSNDLLTSKVKLLHVAPEFTFFRKFRKLTNIQYFPADKFMQGYKYPRGTKNIDISSINFPDNYFDAILCNHVLEHVPDDIQAMKELYRVLKPGGWAILQVPIDCQREITYEDSTITKSEEREKCFGQHDHLRCYGLDYEKRLKQAGYIVDKIDYYSTFSEKDIIKMGLNKGDGIIYFCKK